MLLLLFCVVVFLSWESNLFSLSELSFNILLFIQATLDMVYGMVYFGNIGSMPNTAYIYNTHTRCANIIGDTSMKKVICYLKLIIRIMQFIHII